MNHSSPASAGAVAFGCTLALVVGVRLSAAGLLVTAVLLLGALLLGRSLLLLWLDARLAQLRPDIFVERRAKGGLHPRTRYPMLPMPPPAQRRCGRRGGWPHLFIKGGRYARHPVDG